MNPDIAPLARLRKDEMPPRLPGLPFALIGVLLSGIVAVGFVKEERREWRAYQRQFKDMELARAVTESDRDAARRQPIELTQSILPDLGSVDRCVSCHLGVEDPTYAGAQQPFAYHPDHDLHPFERFGCTVCHSGQGRATSAEAARTVALSTGTNPCCLWAS